MAKKTKTAKRPRPKVKDTLDTSQLFNFARDSYLERTSRPVYAIGFLLPFIVFYEIGTILINTDILDRSQIRVVAFVWLRDLLASIGFSGKFAWVAPPLVVIAILLGLQVTSRKKWSFDLRDVTPMAVECVALAVPLIVLSLFLSSPATPQSHAQPVAYSSVGVQTLPLSGSPNAPAPLQVLAARAHTAALPVRSLLTDIVTGIGAGIYEELVFRLILICLLLVLFQDVLRLSSKSSVILSVLISAALFSAHHHIVFIDGQFGRITDFNWTKFGFRTMAGVYFAILFAIRGFGITAGTHAFYDIIATIVNAVFFR